MFLAAEHYSRGSNNEKDCGTERRLLRAIEHQRKKPIGPVGESQNVFGLEALLSCGWESAHAEVQPP